MDKDEETEIVIPGLTLDFLKQVKLICGAERHHYSMFNVGCSMFILFNVRCSSFKTTPYGKNITCE